MKLYGDFQEGVPLEQAIAELSAAMAEAQACRETPSPTSGTSVAHTRAPISAAAGRPVAVDWPGLIRRYQQHKLRSGEIKESTWERLYKPRMALLLKTAKGPPAARDATTYPFRGWIWCVRQPQTLPVVPGAGLQG